MGVRRGSTCSPSRCRNSGTRAAGVARGPWWPVATNSSTSGPGRRGVSVPTTNASIAPLVSGRDEVLASRASDAQQSRRHAVWGSRPKRENTMSGVMRNSTIFLLVLRALTAQATGGGCPPDELATARATAEAACPCAAATDRGTYIRCVAHTVSAAVRAGALSPECRLAALRTLRSSTCGRSGSVTCCVALGDRTRCRIRTAAACQARSGSCVAMTTACADACTPTGCVTSTTTTTTTTTTTVTNPFCGYGLTAPACDGACPSGSSCQPVLPGSDYCRCVIDTRPCGTIDGAPLCHGSCPAEMPVCVDVGGTCGCTGYPQSFGGQCPTTTTTVPPGPCGMKDYGCGGLCPAGFACELSQSGECGCTGIPQSCGGFNDYPETCGGPCPGGQTCRAVIFHRITNNPSCGTLSTCSCLPE